MSMCCGSWYICATSGEDECSAHGGFTSCCSDPACPGTLPYAHLIEKCAAKLHQDWRREHRGETVSWTTDTHRTVNIVDLSYSKLPEDVQVQYIRAAWRVLRQVEKRSGLDRTAELAHEDWLRNDSEDADPLDRLPYAWLPEEKKARIRTLVLTAAKIRGFKLTA